MGTNVTGAGVAAALVPSARKALRRWAFPQGQLGRMHSRVGPGPRAHQRFQAACHWLHPVRFLHGFLEPFLNWNLLTSLQRPS